MSNWQSEATDRLVRVLTEISSEEKMYRFLEDLCTIKEIMDMSQRLEIAILLKKGTNYQEINRITGVSTATISRVNKCLAYGTGGYREILELLQEAKAEE